MRNRRLPRLVAVAALVALPVLSGACADEDGDGATTDEEIQDVRDSTNDAEDRVEKEVDGQDDGTNDNDNGNDSGDDATTTTGG
jgi:hypothetical protein